MYIEDNRGCRVMQSQQSLTLIETRLSFLYTNALGDLHHLLARRPVNIFLLIKVNQPENLFSLKVIFLKFGATPRKHWIKLHSYRAKVQWAVARKEFTTSRV